MLVHMKDGHNWFSATWCWRCFHSKLVVFFLSHLSTFTEVNNYICALYSLHCCGRSDSSGSDGAVCVYAYVCTHVYVFICVCIYRASYKIYTTIESVSATALTNVAHSLKTVNIEGWSIRIHLGRNTLS